MNGVANLYGDMDITKVMFGRNAIQVPMWMVVQNQQEAVMFAGASRMLNLMYNTDKVHVMIVGDLIVRPRIVIASDEFKGKGIGGFWRHMPCAEEWLEKGEVIIAPGE